LLFAADILTFWQLVVLVFLLSSFNSQGDTARFGLVPALARRAGVRRERANAADRAVVRVGSLVGPLLAGVFIALLGAANVLLIDALTFCTSAALVAIGVPAALGRPTSDASRRGTGYMRELREGLRFIRSNTVLLSVVLVITIGNSLDKPLTSVVAPVYADEIYGSPQSLGVMVGAFGGGALVGTLLFGAIGRRWPRRLTFLGCFVTAPLIAFGTLALTPPLPVVVAAVFVSGLVAGPINPLFETVVQERTPSHMLGRTFGALTALAYAGIPIGAVLAGVAIEAFGLVETIVGMGALYVAVTLGMFLNPALRGMDTAEEARSRRHHPYAATRTSG
jgi:predicted MFS family arabinose efflux permease